jgi:site-specific recombinase XerD
MKDFKNINRYQMLIGQFQADCDVCERMKRSLERVFLYVYTYTNIYYIEFINEKVLINYIKFHCSRNFKETSIIEIIKDVKNFIDFLERKGVKNTPKVDLSVKNFSFWTRL